MTPQMLPWTWSFEPSVILGLLIAAGLYAVGVRYSLRGGMGHHLSPWRWVWYSLGLLTILVALESPIDAWADMYLWAHMVQHILLLYVAAPLILLGLPLMPVWRAVPLEARRSSLRWVMTHRRPRRVFLAIGHLFSMPWTVWFIFVLDFVAWHTTALYNLALQNQIVHDFEHLCFLGTGLLFWAQVIPSAPLKPRLGPAAQPFYVLLAGFAVELVGMVLTYSGNALYPHYLHVPRPAGSLTPLADQVSAAALMNITDLVFYGFAFLFLLWLWLDNAMKSETDEDWYGRPAPYLPSQQTEV